MFTKHDKKLCRRDRGFSPKVPAVWIQLYNALDLQGEKESCNPDGAALSDLAFQGLQVTAGCLGKSLAGNISLSSQI